MNPGDRVGCILSSHEGVVEFLGYGVYEGDFDPDAEAKGLAEVCRESKWTNPRIRLDNGKVVWGCECWWGPESEVAAQIAGCKVIAVDIDAVRAAE